jgi:hypothetical protein
MIRVERETTSRNGRYRFTIPAYGIVGGPSRQPLLDACRAALAAGADPSQQIALYRGSSTEWDLKTTVGYGASKTVSEEQAGIRLRNFTPSEWKDAAE